MTKRQQLSDLANAIANYGFECYRAGAEGNRDHIPGVSAVVEPLAKLIRDLDKAERELAEQDAKIEALEAGIRGSFDGPR